MQARSLLFNLWGDYIQHVGGEAWTSTLSRFTAPFGISEPALRQALSRLTRQGWLTSRRAAGRSCYSLTDQGRRRLAEACRRVYDPVDQPWDGKWRLLTYSIPEPIRGKRDDLRRELIWTGFAPLTSGAWISPNPLEDALSALITRYGIQPYVHSFVAQHSGPGTPQDLVAGCWDLEAIQASYSQFIEAWAPHLATLQSRPLPSGEACFVLRIELVHAYRKFLFVDPGLPRELLPERWRGWEARQLFQDLYRLVDPGARQFMDAAFEPIDRSAVGAD